MQVRRKRLLTWKDESPAQDGQPAQLCEVRVLSGLGPPKQATGHSFAEQVLLTLLAVPKALKSMEHEMHAGNR